MKVGSLLGGFFDGFIGSVMDNIGSAFGWFFYAMWRLLAYIVTTLEDMFRLLAGIDKGVTMKGEGNVLGPTLDPQKTDIVSILINSTTVKNVFPPLWLFR